MNKTSIAAGAIFAACLGVFASSDAEAGTRLHFNYFTYEPEYQTYYPGPLYVPRPRYFYYHDYDPDPPYAYDYEPDYYEPQVQPRRYQRPSKPPYATRKLQQQKALSYEEPEYLATRPPRSLPIMDLPASSRQIAKAWYIRSKAAGTANLTPSSSAPRAANLRKLRSCKL
jgi:hypothetical protein